MDAVSEHANTHVHSGQPYVGFADVAAAATDQSSRLHGGLAAGASSLQCMLLQPQKQSLVVAVVDAALLVLHHLKPFSSAAGRHKSDARCRWQAPPPPTPLPPEPQQREQPLSSLPPPASSGPCRLQRTQSTYSGKQLTCGLHSKLQTGLLLAVKCCFSVPALSRRLMLPSYSPNASIMPSGVQAMHTTLLFTCRHKHK